MSLSDAVICDTRRNEMEIYSFRNEKFVIREMQINNLQKENLCEGLHRPERWIGHFTISVDCIRNLANNRNYYYRSDPNQNFFPQLIEALRCNNGKWHEIIVLFPCCGRMSDASNLIVAHSNSSSTTNIMVVKQSMSGIAHLGKGSDNFPNYRFAFYGLMAQFFFSHC